MIRKLIQKLYRRDELIFTLAQSNRIDVCQGIYVEIINTYKNTQKQSTAATKNLLNKTYTKATLYTEHEIA